MVYDFDDVGEGYFDDFAVGALHFDAGLGESLRGLHAADYAAHTAAVFGHYLYIVFAVERLQCCQGFCNFHDFSFLSFGRFSLADRYQRKPSGLPGVPPAIF
jgi:hypothetical protein